MITECVGPQLKNDIKANENIGSGAHVLIHATGSVFVYPPPLWYEHHSSSECTKSLHRWIGFYERYMMKPHKRSEWKK
jgi:hypothetical protein